MEYLMTYGWAILVIAVVMVALYYLGILNGNQSSGPTTCVPNAGFMCYGPLYSATSGNIVITVGQATGVRWLSANIAYVNTGTNENNPATLFTAGTENTVYSNNGLSSGESEAVTVPVSTPNADAGGTRIGDTYSGEVWAQYTQSGGQGFYYVQLATAKLKAS